MPVRQQRMNPERSHHASSFTEIWPQARKLSSFKKTVARKRVHFKKVRCFIWLRHMMERFAKTGSEAVTIKGPEAAKYT
jgi:hypothetical protein